MHREGFNTQCFGSPQNIWIAIVPSRYCMHRQKMVHSLFTDKLMKNHYLQVIRITKFSNRLTASSTILLIILLSCTEQPGGSPRCIQKAKLSWKLSSTYRYTTRLRRKSIRTHWTRMNWNIKVITFNLAWSFHIKPHSVIRQTTKWPTVWCSCSAASALVFVASGERNFKWLSIARTLGREVALHSDNYTKPFDNYEICTVSTFFSCFTLHFPLYFTHTHTLYLQHSTYHFVCVIVDEQMANKYKCHRNEVRCILSKVFMVLWFSKHIHKHISSVPRPSRNLVHNERTRLIHLNVFLVCNFQFTCYRLKTMYWLFMHGAFHMHTRYDTERITKFFGWNIFNGLVQYSVVGYAQLCRIIKFPPLQSLL